MYVFKNAFKNITRARGRTILIFTLVLIIAISACISLTIKSSADKAKETAYSNMSVTAQIGVDRTLMMNNQSRDPEGMREMMELMSESMSIEEFEKYATSEYVENFYFTSSFSLNSIEDGIESYSLDNGMGNMQGGGGQMGGSILLNSAMGDFTVVGYSSHDAMTEFIDGTLAISEGTVFVEDDVDNLALISIEIATLNELEVGDTIELANPMKEDELIEVTVSGIFISESTDAFANDIYISYASLENICSSSELVAETVVDDMTGIERSTALTSRVDGTYVFESPEQLEAFEIDVENMGLDTTIYAVTSTDIDEFNRSMIPLDNLTSFTMFFFIVVLIIGAIILIVFNLFTIRERKYEIGVLAAIGMQKSKVAVQFLSEVIIVTFIAVLLGTGIGSIASAPIGEALLENQVQSIETESQEVNANFGGGFGGGREMGREEIFTNNVEYVDTIVASTDFNVLLQLMGIGILLSLIASSIGIISILRYDPLKILSERA